MRCVVMVTKNDADEFLFERSKCSRAPGVTNKTIPLPPCDNCSVNGIVCTYTVSSKKRSAHRNEVTAVVADHLCSEDRRKGTSRCSRESCID